MTYTDSDGTTYEVFLNVCEELNIPCPDENHKKNIPACQQKPDDADFGRSMGTVHETLLRSVTYRLQIFLPTWKFRNLETPLIRFSCHFQSVCFGIKEGTLLTSRSLFILELHLNEGTCSQLEHFFSRKSIPLYIEKLTQYIEVISLGIIIAPF